MHQIFIQNFDRNHRSAMSSNSAPIILLKIKKYN
jgi:hypothetical protein